MSTAIVRLTCGSLKWFEGDRRRFGYIYQMAFYRAVLREATGENVPVQVDDGNMANAIPTFLAYMHAP